MKELQLARTLQAEPITKQFHGSSHCFFWNAYCLYFFLGAAAPEAAAALAAASALARSWAGAELRVRAKAQDRGRASEGKFGARASARAKGL